MLMRRLRAILYASVITVLAAPAGAQVSAQGETWRITRDRVEYSIAEWGPGCGPRPEDRSNATGREVTVRAVGEDLEFSTGGRRQRTDQCWSDNRSTEALAHARVGGTWNVSCATPAGESLGERGTYTVTLEGDRISMRGETRYAWTLQGSSCRATATATRTYERVSGAPAPAPTPPPPTPPPTPPPAPAPPPAPRPAPTPAPSPRCTPGDPVTLALSPSRRSTTSGGRVCFRARATDASRCESSARSVSWSVRRVRGGGEASMDRGCFVSARGGGVGLFEVAASAGGLSARAEVEVVTEDRYADLVAQRIEDPDGGTPEENSGSQVGVGVLGPETRRDHTSLLFALGGGAALLLLVLLLAQRRRAPKPSDDDDDDGARPRREVMPPPQFAEPTSPTEPPPENRRRPEPPEPSVAPAPPVAPVAPSPRHCPYCRKVYVSDLAFCPDDGQPLAPGASLPPEVEVTTAAAPEPREKRCPTCGRNYPGYMDFCGEDGAALTPR
ncbi:MAG: hypothetical protein R3A48_26200 [Polyangiales bacterium]